MAFLFVAIDTAARMFRAWEITFEIYIFLVFFVFEQELQVVFFSKFGQLGFIRGEKGYEILT